MKVGILTQPLINNYGGILQNYALQQVLRGMGHNVETIDWRKDYSRWYKMVVRAKRTLLSLVRKDIKKPGHIPTSAEFAVISRNTRSFIERNLSLCPLQVKHQEDFLIIDRQYGYDAYVVGSDQVWRPEYNPYLDAMFLSFVQRKNVKRIAFAASFGKSEWEFTDHMTEVCSQLAKRFNLITVREESGIKLCQDYLGVTAKQVLDPTMLLSREDYVKLADVESELYSKGYLFHYILDPSSEKKEIIKQVASQLGLRPFSTMPNNYLNVSLNSRANLNIEDCVFPPVSSWLRGFMGAEMTLVDSFHGAVFSVIFNKPFWVIGNSERGNARFESLLKTFGLEDRMISIGDTQRVEWNKPINWKRVNDILEQEKKMSLDLLSQEFNNNLTS